MMSIPVFVIGQIALNLFEDDPKNLPSLVACLGEAAPAKAEEGNLEQRSLL
jgi:hypothetical protein